MILQSSNSIKKKPPFHGGFALFRFTEPVIPFVVRKADTEDAGQDHGRARNLKRGERFAQQEHAGQNADHGAPGAGS